MPDPIQTTTLLLGTAASLAIVHTLLGIDHSLPFVALGRARGWTLGRTLAVTAACGAGHVASSVLIGAFGVGLGIATNRLLWLESARGELAAALLIGFGLAYAAWAIWRRLRGLDDAHGHVTERRAPGPMQTKRAVTPGALFVVFLLGPCEPLIPLMVVPGIARDWVTLAAVVTVFGLLTVTVMLAAVAVGYRGASWLAAAPLDASGRVGLDLLRRHADVAAGLVVAGSGATVLLLGL